MFSAATENTSTKGNMNRRSVRPAASSEMALRPK
jgi:hypothetical protein